MPICSRTLFPTLLSMIQSIIAQTSSSGWMEGRLQRHRVFCLHNSVQVGVYYLFEFISPRNPLFALNRHMAQWWDVVTRLLSSSCESARSGIEEKCSQLVIECADKRLQDRGTCLHASTSRANATYMWRYYNVPTTTCSGGSVCSHGLCEVKVSLLC